MLHNQNNRAEIKEQHDSRKNNKASVKEFVRMRKLKQKDESF